MRSTTSALKSDLADVGKAKPEERYLGRASTGIAECLVSTSRRIRGTFFGVHLAPKVSKSSV